MSLKSLIKSAGRSVGIEVTRYRPPVTVEAEKVQPQKMENESYGSPLPWRAGIWRWPAINPLPLAVSDTLLKGIRAGRDASDFTLIQIGAYDGTTNDPVRKCINEYGLRTILVEPQPDVFKMLVKSYEGKSNVSFENAAISSEDGETIMYRFKQIPNARSLTSLSRDTLIHNHHQILGETEEIVVKVMTLASLMKKHAISSVDFLQIDAEGHDWNIIRSIDLTTIKPSIIHYEISILPERDQNASIAHLASNGYSVLWYGTADLLAYRQPDVDSPIIVK